MLTLAAVISFHLLLSAVLIFVARLITAQVQMSSGFVESPVVGAVYHTFRRFFHVRNQTNLRTFCAVNTPAQIFDNSSDHDRCTANCFNYYGCVAYNFYWKTTRCELFVIPPSKVVYDSVCVLHQVGVIFMTSYTYHIKPL